MKLRAGGAARPAAAVLRSRCVARPHVTRPAFRQRAQANERQQRHRLQHQQREEREEARCEQWRVLQRDARADDRARDSARRACGERVEPLVQHDSGGGAGGALRRRRLCAALAIASGGACKARRASMCMPSMLPLGRRASWLQQQQRLLLSSSTCAAAAGRIRPRGGQAAVVAGGRRAPRRRRHWRMTLERVVVPCERGGRRSNTLAASPRVAAAAAAVAHQATPRPSPTASSLSPPPRARLGGPSSAEAAVAPCARELVPPLYVHPRCTAPLSLLPAIVRSSVVARGCAQSMRCVAGGALTYSAYEAKSSHEFPRVPRGGAPLLGKSGCQRPRTRARIRAAAGSC